MYKRVKHLVAVWNRQALLAAKTAHCIGGFKVLEVR